MEAIDYKLAKQLEEVGFPYKRPEDFPYMPELSELIEACGEKLYILKRRGIGGNAWEAKDYEGNYGHSENDPEEAVARLYIKLHG